MPAVLGKRSASSTTAGAAAASTTASSAASPCAAKARYAVTPFQARVYAALLRVPRGRVVTYKALAAAVGCASMQAVGQALRANPFAPFVPCHRVVASTLRLGGFSGQTDLASRELRRKRALLKGEGVAFDLDGALCSSSRAALLADVPAASDDDMSADALLLGAADVMHSAMKARAAEPADLRSLSNDPLDV